VDPRVCVPKLKITVLYNRLTDGSEVVNLARRPPFTPRKIPGTHISIKTPSRPEGNSEAEMIRSTEKSNDKRESNPSLSP
jgi:tRNA/tmRNA/rRNA uracil-C5-methylase (TrmA/RlmC/RlmD family)